ncbi:unnamed protein product [Dicrocoelium dendriticum]|nr:unnamed protein product [Dicrocoelium dendriticum]
MLAQQAKQWYEEDMVKYRAAVYVPVQKKPAGALSNPATVDLTETFGLDANSVSCAGGGENEAELEDEDDDEPDEGEDE